MTSLIIDCGSSHARWLLTRSDGSREYLDTPGFNASALSRDEIIHIISPAASFITSAGDIKFYGAGCRPGTSSQVVTEALRHYAPHATILATSDIYAAIHALAPSDEAIVAIVGTGVNAVAVKDGEIIDAVTSTGYILGDHGSGAALGRELMGLYVSGVLPDELSQELEKQYCVSKASVIESVYRGASPRQFLGSFAPFILSHASVPEIARLIETQMRKLVATSFLPLLKRHDAPLRLSGSIAHHFRPYIQAALTEAMPYAVIDRVVASPIGHIRP